MDFFVEFFRGLFSSPGGVFAVISFILVIIPSSIYTATSYHPKDPLGYISKFLLWSISVFLCAVSPFSILLFFAYRYIYRKISYQIVKKKSIISLTNSISKILSLNYDSKESLRDFVELFTNAICGSKKLTIKDIDDFIDWLYLNGFVLPSYEQHRHLGMNIVITHKIYVPETIRSSFSDWKAFRGRAIDAGLLLTSNKADPSIELWNMELSVFLPNCFSIDPPYSAPDSVLERIVQLAEESLADRASLPEFIARMAELDHQPESSYFDNLDSNLEQAIRNHARTLKLTEEKKPEDFKSIIQRICSHADRFAIVRGWETQKLLSEEIEQMKNKLQRKQVK